MKEPLLKRLDEVSFDVFRFKWENAYKLSQRELEFILAVLSKAYIHEQCLIKITGGSKTQIESLVEEVTKEQNLNVEHSYVGKKQDGLF